MTHYMERARAGDVTAMVALAGCYYSGSGGLKRDDGEALVWWGKAGAKGHGHALGMLGYMHENGLGTPVNLNKALSYYIQANDRGFECEDEIARVQSAVAANPALRATTAAAASPRATASTAPPPRAAATAPTLPRFASAVATSPSKAATKPYTRMELPVLNSLFPDYDNEDAYMTDEDQFDDYEFAKPATKPADDPAKPAAAPQPRAAAAAFASNARTAEVQQRAAENARKEPEKTPAPKVAAKTKHPSTWVDNDVDAWLASVGLSHLQLNFQKHRIVGDAFATLGPEDYDDLGVTVLGDRKNLKAKHAELLARFTSAAPPSSAPYQPPPASTPASDPTSWQLSRTAVQLGAQLGQGSFGTVYRGTYSGIEVAVKKPTGAATTSQINEAKREAALMKGLPAHPNVLTFYGACIDNQGILIVTEICDAGSLDDYLRTNPKLEASTRLQFAVQIARGMAHLHSLTPPILHRDLAARNILIADTKKGLMAKVADFGMARVLQSEQYQFVTTKTKVPIRWAPPEVLNDLAAVPASDVWSFGVTAWEIYSRGIVPYHELDDSEEVVNFVVKQKETLGKPALCPPPVWAVLTTSFAYEPARRPTFPALVASLSAL